MSPPRPLPDQQTTQARLADGLLAEGAQPTVLIWLSSGERVPLYASDMFYDPFVPDPDFAYVFGVRCPGFRGAIVASATSRQVTLYPPEYPPNHEIWEGPEETPEQLRVAYGVDRVIPRPRMAEDLAPYLGRDDVAVHVLDAACAQAELQTGVMASSRLRTSISELRAIKTPHEIAIMRKAAEASCAAHIAVMAAAKPGVRPRDLEALFEYRVRVAGCEGLAYPTICAPGPCAAILHFTRGYDQPLQSGELLLLDAGGKLAGYASDITRTYPVAGAFAHEAQQHMYESVLRAQAVAEALLRPGVAWRDVHRAAIVEIATQLVARTAWFNAAAPLDLVVRATAALLMPHGIGHLLGLNVHDVGGSEPNGASTSPSLRLDRELKPGMVVTVEPGIYLNWAMIRAGLGRQPDLREAFDGKAFTQEAVGDLGGVRIEDNYLITADGAERITSGVPRELDEVLCAVRGS